MYRVWARALGRPVVYGGDDLEAWEKQSLQYMPDWLVFDFKQMYDFFQKQGLKASPEAIERQTKLLGHTPRSLRRQRAIRSAMTRSKAVCRSALSPTRTASRSTRCPGGA